MGAPQMTFARDLRIAVVFGVSFGVIEDVQRG